MQLALGKSKEQVLALAKHGNTIEKPEDTIKDTYTLDFLKIPEAKPSESTLEDALIANLERNLHVKMHVNKKSHLQSFDY